MNQIQCKRKLLDFMTSNIRFLLSILLLNNKRKSGHMLVSERGVIYVVFYTSILNSTDIGIGRKSNSVPHRHKKKHSNTFFREVNDSLFSKAN